MKQRHKPLNKTKRPGSVDDDTTTTTTTTQTQATAQPQPHAQSDQSWPQVPSGPQDDVLLAGSTISAKVDYTNLLKMRPQDEDEYFRKIAPLLAGKIDDPLAYVKNLDAAGQRWLKHAVALYLHNAKTLPHGFDHGAALHRLFERAKKPAAKPGQEGQAFEREVLWASGWWAQSLASRLKKPVATAELAEIYNPTATAASRTADVPRTTSVPQNTPSRLDRAALKGGLRAALKDFLAVQRNDWPEPRTRESIETFRAAARFIQTFIERRPSEWRDYVAAGPQCPSATGYDYAPNVHATEDITADPDKVFSHLLTRTVQIGGSEDYGQPLVKAGYNSRIKQDRDTLQEVLKELMLERDIYDAAADVVRHTAKHSGDGTAHLVTTVPVAKTRADWRWKQAHTLVHELLHHLAHPAYNKKTREIENTPVLREGIAEAITTDVFTALAQYVKQDETAHAWILGDTPYAPPPADLLKTRYENAGESAETIRARAGTTNMYAAFFLGATPLIGLD